MRPSLRTLAYAFVAVAIVATALALPANGEQVEYAGALIDSSLLASLPAQSHGTYVEGPLPEPSTYGTTQWITYTVGPCDATTRSGGTGVVSNGNCNGLGPAAAGTNVYVGFPMHLDTGVSLQYVRAYYFSDNTGGSLSAGLWKVNHVGGTMTMIQVMSPPATAAGESSTQWGPFSDTVDTYTYTYAFLAIINRGASGNFLVRQFLAYYKLQVSPAPATASFTDVPTSYWAFQYIEALKASGITGGVTPTTFEPESNVTRAQMAVFMAKALGLHFGLP